MSETERTKYAIDNAFKEIIDQDKKKFTKELEQARLNQNNSRYDAARYNVLKHAQDIGKEHEVFTESIRHEVEQPVSRDNIIRKSMSKTKVSFNPRKAELKSKVVCLGTCACLIASSLMILNYGYNEMQKDEIQAYEPNYDVYSKANNDSVNQDLMDMLVDIRVNYEDEIAGLYMLYNKLDGNLSNNTDKVIPTNTNKVINEFNMVYGTNYSSVQDALQTTKIKTVKDWNAYTARILMQKANVEGEEYDESNSFGRQ